MYRTHDGIPRGHTRNNGIKATADVDCRSLVGTKSDWPFIIPIAMKGSWPKRFDHATRRNLIKERNSISGKDCEWPQQDTIWVASACESESAYDGSCTGSGSEGGREHVVQSGSSVFEIRRREANDRQ